MPTTRALTSLPAVSVIVALHNPGSYLEEFLNRASLLAAIDGVELIIVDDHSTDGSAGVLRAWDPPASCLTVFNETNLGVALTRNKALELATGEFVWFIDHDDIWSGEGLHTLRLQARNADIVIGCADYQYGPTHRERRRIEQTPAAQRVTGTDASRMLLDGVVQGFLWTKLIRRSALGAEPFPPQRSQSDIVGVARSLAAAESVAFVDEVVYTYMRREGSITRVSSPSLASLESARDEVIAATAHRAAPHHIDHFIAWFFCLAAVKTAVRWKASTSDLRLAVASAADQSRRISLIAVVRRSRSHAALILLLRTLPALLPWFIAAGFLGLDIIREVRGRFGVVVRRLVGFSVLPAITALTPLLAIPTITSTTGAYGWVAVALGQSVGGVGAVIVELGWSAFGSQRVARQASLNRLQNAALALGVRSVMSIPILLIAGLIAFAISPDYKPVAAGVAIATCLAANNLVWFFIGLGRPRLILLTDALPRCLLALASVIVVHALGELWPYAAALLLANAIAVLLGCAAIGLRPQYFAGITPRMMFFAIRFHTVLMSGRLLSASYIVLPTSLISLVAPSSVAAFAAADRLQRMTLNALASMPNTFQSWVGGNQRAERIRRSVLALLVNTSFGIAAGLAFTLLAPSASQLLFSGVATLPRSSAAICGLIILATCISRATGGLILPALGRVNAIALSAGAGFVVGVPMVVIGAITLGARGALLGMLIAELSVLTVQIIAIRRLVGATRKV